MSESLREIIDREAEEAEEAETIEGDDDDTEEPDDDDDAEAHAARVAAAEKAIDHDARDKALQKQDTSHVNALKRIYGDDFASRTRCAACDGEGWVELSPELLHLMIELGQQARNALGETGADLPLAPFAEVCDMCHGYGNLRTGSKTDHGAILMCRKCAGAGWLDKEELERKARLGITENGGSHHVQQFPVYHGDAATQQQQQAQTVSPPSGWESAGRPGVDAYGRWPGHPRYGIDPTQGGW